MFLMSSTSWPRKTTAEVVKELLEDADLGPLEDIDWDIDAVTRS